MPELPEIETIKRSLKILEDKTVASVTANDEMIYQSPLTPRKIEQFLVDRTIDTISRQAKYLVFELDENALLFSLRMTGKLLLHSTETQTNKNVKLYVEFNDYDQILVFTSIRRFSRIHRIDYDDPEEHPKLQKIGPDPLSTQYTWSAFLDSLDNRTAPVKSLLMNQEVLAGIGNIYANEICYRSQIHPKRPVNELDELKLNTLYEVIPRVLREAVETGGSSFINFKNSNGNPGQYQRFFRVFQREDEYCVRCTGIIEKTTLSGRGTFFCPDCQF